MASGARLRVNRDAEEGATAVGASIACSTSTPSTTDHGHVGRRSSTSGGRWAAHLLGMAAFSTVVALACWRWLLVGGDLSQPSGHLHFAWVTDCSEYQEWQSLVLLWTIYRWQGPNTPATCLISGCNETQQTARTRTHHILFTQADGQLPPELFFTPAYTFNEELNDTYPPYNRPHSIRLWVQERALHPDTWVVLLDPDMVMTAPLSIPVSGDIGVAGASSILYHGNLGLEAASRLPALGQRYRYIGNHWDTANLSLQEICEPWADGCLGLHAEEIAEFFSIGPPWIVRFRDLRRAAPLWHAYTPRIRRQYRQLIAEMYAYCLAFASFGVRHALYDHFVTSYPNAPAHEQAWSWIDGGPVESPDPCVPEGLAAQTRRPAFLHYCEIYYVDEWYFRKRQVPHEKVLACEAPLFAQPPAGLLRHLRESHSAAGDASNWARNKERQAWFMCTLISTLNEAVKSLRGPLCPQGFNDTQALRVPPPEDAFSTALRSFFNSPPGTL